MMELEIKGQVYQFNFGMGFLREVNKWQVSQKGFANGISYVVASVMDRDMDVVSDTLFAANKGCNPRIAQTKIDEYIEDEATDVDALCEKIMGFLETSNATKKTTERILKAAEVLKAQEE